MSARPPPREPRTDFGPAPPGYIPGIGRGAIGFTTRSDIGPARPAGAAEPTAGAGATLPLGKGRAAAAAAALGIKLPVGVDAFPVGDKMPPGLTKEQIAKAKAEQEDKEDLSESQFDPFEGYKGDILLFASLPYDEEDKEADAIYALVDRRMDERRKRKREEREKKELEEYRKKRPVLEEMFAVHKRQLGEMTVEDWESIPEALDYSRQYKINQKNRDKYTPAPDSLIASSRPDTQTVAFLDHKQMKYGGLETPVGGWQTPVNGMATPIVGGDLTGLRKVRDQVLQVKLDRMADSVSGQTVVDPKGYLTDLNSLKISSEAEVSDIKKARLLLNSVITTNPKHAPGWIAAARLEKETGKLSQARAIIMKGCEMCPTNEDVWLEAARLHTPKQAKAILAKAVKHIPTSVKIWLRACDLEEDLDLKKAVLRKALEVVPKSVALWKAAIELENPEDARIMLQRAVELIPESVEMWLALARLSSYEDAKGVLNRARQAIPTEPQIWITAAKLEEANGNVQNVRAIIAKAVRSLAAHQVVIDREHWMQMAEEAEKAGAPATCHAIIAETIGQGVEEQDRKSTWMNDAEAMVAKGSIETARAIYQHMLQFFPQKKSVWLAAAHFEKQYGTREALDALLEQATNEKNCPGEEILWLMWAKEKWLARDVEAARRILNQAFKTNPDSEQIWLAAVKLESEEKEFERARMILQIARERAPTPKVYRRSAKLEKYLGNRERERELLEEGLKKFPDNDKLWVMLAEYQQETKQLDAARETFKKGTKNCPTSVRLWLAYAEHEATFANNVQKARAVLETARLKVPKNPELWLAAIRLEQRVDNHKKAQQMIAQALQECPKSGILWAHAIASDARQARKSRTHTALNE